jgi:DNA-binding beta-propeller fold protein YncE
MAAAFVVGQNNFDTGASSALKSPYDVAVDSAANLYVADFGNNRVLTFQPLVFLPVAGAAPTAVVGQRELTGTSPNWNGTAGAATSESLFGPAGLFLDRQDTLYVGDTGNNRVVHFLKAASVVNSATYLRGVPVAPGALAAAFGTDLATESSTADGAPWPATLGNREIVFNDEIAAPLQ